MRFGVLGPLAVWTSDGKPVRVPELKVRALLADLLMHQGRPVSADRLVDDLWGEEPPGNPSNTLQTKVSQLRRALEKAEPGSRDLVALRPAGYLMEIEPDALDVGRFTALTAQARSTEDAQARAGLLADALVLWRGPAFADFRDEEFSQAAIALLEEQRLTCLEEQAEVRLELGEHGMLADELGDLVAQHPLRERLRAAHLRALYRAGRQNEALASFSDLQEQLAEELGLDPGPDLAALHQAILEQDPALAPVPAPATSAARPRTNLPAPVTSLIGRDESVARVRKLLDGARLVTLTGPGGVGKTRLALETAGQMSFADGVWLVELAGQTLDIAEVVAAVLGIRDDTATGSRPGVAPASLGERLANALGGQELLLVLDNCEHVIDAVAELAELLLQRVPGLHILATSQEALAITGEYLEVVPPLPEAAAAELFIARASGFTPDAEDSLAIASICRRLDGLPLALELAATKVRALGVQKLSSRLDDRFKVLTGKRGGPDRQQTLRAVIDWSWELLTEPEQIVLRRLAVHAGGCTLEAAEQVCAGPDLDVLDLLTRLVDRSLVVFAGGRYRLLESVAAYCRERLQEVGEFDLIQLRHATFYTELAEEAEPHLRGRDQRRWLRLLDAEAANLQGAAQTELAVRLVNAASWYWFLRGRHREAHRSLTLAGSEDPVTRAWHAGFAILVGDGTDLGQHSRTALSAFDGVDDPEHRARAEWFLGLAHLHFGDVATGADLIGKALTTFRVLDDRWGVAAALAGRTKLAMFRGDLPAAERDGTQSIALFEDIGDRWGLLQASDMLGYLAEVTGDYDRASRLHREGLRIAEELHLWTDVSYRLSSLGRITLLTGDFARSKEFHERGMRLAAEQSNQFAEEFARVGLALGARRQGDLDLAETQLRDSLAWNRRLEADFGVPFYGVTLLLAELGFIAELRGDLPRARSLHQEGLTAARKIDDPRAIALALEGLAGAQTAADETARLLGMATTLRESIGAPLPPAERGDTDRISARARSILGENAYAVHYTEGTDLGPAELPSSATPARSG
jgi:predicted ATPase/DNA-binding SARP family transcriptional activator